MATPRDDDITGDIDYDAERALDEDELAAEAGLDTEIDPPLDAPIADYVDQHRPVPLDDDRDT
jgi:hypothetical protein